MRMGVLLFAAIAVVVVVPVGAVVFTPLGYPILRNMFPPGDIAPVDWAEIRLNNEPARWLVCPGYDLCTELNDRTAIFDASVDRLMQEWQRVMKEEEEVMEVVLSDDGTRQYTYLIRSSFLQLPDLVTVEFVEFNEDEDRPRSSVAIYSRRVYVSGDFGANSGRVTRYLDHLETVLGIYRR